MAQAKIDSLAEERECGPLRSTDSQLLSPQDYRTDRARLQVVEDYHFSPEIEYLIKPKLSTFGAAISYTLHGYPNHARALATLVRLGEREKSDKPPGSIYTIDCWFRRALRFVPDDHVVRMLYAEYLGRRGRRDDAIRQADFVDENAPMDPLTRRNVALVFFDLKLPERARAQLEKTDADDPVMAELRRKLEVAIEVPDNSAAAVRAPAR